MSKGVVAPGRCRRGGTRRTVAGIVVTAVGAAIGAVSAMIARTHQRRSLAKLDDHLLRDIGLTRDDVRRELEKPFWRE